MVNISVFVIKESFVKAPANHSVVSRLGKFNDPPWVELAADVLLVTVS